MNKIIRENQEKRESMGKNTDMNSKDAMLDVLMEADEETDYSEDGEEGEEEAKEQRTRASTIVGATPRVNASVPLTIRSVAERSSVPSPVDSIGEDHGGTYTVLRGTISSLKGLKQTAGLTLAPGLQSLVGLALNISEIVNVSFDTHASRVYSNTIDLKECA